MNRLLLLSLACIFFIIGLGIQPFQSYSHHAIGIITYADTYQRPDGNYVCDLKLSYNPNSFTLLHQVPLKTVSKTNHLFGETPTVYFNPKDPLTISLSQYTPTNPINLYFILLAMATFFLGTYQNNT
jgi:hypothetical protein